MTTNDANSINYYFCVVEKFSFACSNWPNWIKWKLSSATRAKRERKRDSIWQTIEKIEDTSKLYLMLQCHCCQCLFGMYLFYERPDFDLDFHWKKYCRTVYNSSENRDFLELAAPSSFCVSVQDDEKKGAKRYFIYWYTVSIDILGHVHLNIFIWSPSMMYSHKNIVHIDRPTVSAVSF